jgi:hypothetical protein
VPYSQRRPTGGRARAHKYLHLVQPQVAIHKRAHIRSLFADVSPASVCPPSIAEAIPALLHISVFLFLAGLVISLFTIRHTVSYVILSATLVYSLMYAAITVMPIVYHDGPYTSPISAPASYISRKLLVVFNIVDNVMGFSWDFRCSVRRRDDDALGTPASRGLVI